MNPFDPESNTPPPDVVIAAAPASQDLRMYVQQGVFTVHTSREPLEDLQDAASWLARMEIPARECRRVADELTCLGFRRGDIFPDLDNLSAELKERYPPQPTQVPDG